MRKSLLVLTVLAMAVMTVLFVASFSSSSSAQNANSSTTQNSNSPTTTNKSETRSIAPGAQEDFSKNTWELPEDADKTKNPVPTSAESVAKGKELYLDRMKGNCIFCHGENGAGNEANFPRLRRKPADISNKERMSAMTDGELYWKITKGINGIMPAGTRRMNDEERWNVVNYIRTLVKTE